MHTYLGELKQTNIEDSVVAKIFLSIQLKQRLLPQNS